MVFHDSSKCSLFLFIFFFNSIVFIAPDEGIKIRGELIVTRISGFEEFVDHPTRDQKGVGLHDRQSSTFVENLIRYNSTRSARNVLSATVSATASSLQ